MTIPLATTSRDLAGRAAVLTAFLLVAACGGDDDVAATDATTADGAATSAAIDSGTESSPDSTQDAAAADCSPESLQTLAEGVLTFGTSEPAFEPWMVDNDPANGEGYESAVAYAVAEQLGYAEDEVSWVRVPFEAAIAPGPKDFDAAINQFSITEERRTAVDFSSSYYDARQAVVAVEGSAAAEATSLAELEDVLFGAQVGTTSLAAVEQAVAPSQQPQVFNSNEDAKLALDNGQIDALVVDLPTALYLSAVEIEGGVVVGQLPQVDGDTEQLGMVLDLGSPLTDCVSGAVDELAADGTLDALQSEWLTDTAGAPELE